MRTLFTLVLGLWIMMAALLFGARSIGQRDARGPVLPLPDAEGCWYGTCFTAVRQMDLRDTLVHHPLVTQIGPQTGPGAYRVVVRLNDDVARGVVIQASAEGYMLLWDWSVPGNPALMTLGDLVRAYGPPDRVDLGRQQGPLLWYVDHNASVAVGAAQSGVGWARFAPDDPVTRINGYDPPLAAEVLATTARDKAITTHGWHGFGTYVREVE